MPGRNALKTTPQGEGEDGRHGLEQKWGMAPSSVNRHLRRRAWMRGSQVDLVIVVALFCAALRGLGHLL